jgi:hypothetical protein
MRLPLLSLFPLSGVLFHFTQSQTISYENAPARIFHVLSSVDIDLKEKVLSPLKAATNTEFVFNYK